MVIIDRSAKGYLSQNLPIGQHASIGQIHRASIKSEADTPAAGQSIIDELIDSMLNIDLRVNSGGIRAPFRRVISITRAASESQVLADRSLEKQPAVPLFRITEKRIHTGVMDQPA